MKFLDVLIMFFGVFMVMSAGFGVDILFALRGMGRITMAVFLAMLVMAGVVLIHRGWGCPI
jgi:hypothetical protein